MTDYVQFISSAAADTDGSCVLLHFEHHDFLVGSIHEGTQRAMAEESVTGMRTTNLFITGRVNWKNMGGLAGMLLTLADVKRHGLAAQELERLEKLARRKKNYLDAQSRNDTKAMSRIANVRRGPGATFEDGRESAAAGGTGDLDFLDIDPPPEMVPINIYAGPNILHSLASMRGFVFRNDVPIDVHEVGADTANLSPAPLFDDGKSIKVWPILTTPEPINAEGQRSALKRKFDQLSDALDTDAAAAAARQKKDNGFLADMVGAMFKNASLNRLVETPLKDVQLPASLWVRDKQSGGMASYAGPLPGGDQPLPDIDVFVHKQKPYLEERIPEATRSEACLSYVFRPYDHRGRFKPELAQAAGIPNTLWKNLHQGGMQTLPDGRVVDCDQFVGASVPRPGFAILEVPSKEYIAPLSHQLGEAHKQNMEGVTNILWILGPGVYYNPEFQQLTSEMSNVTHVISSQDVSDNKIVYRAAAAANIQLNTLDPDHYVVPYSGVAKEALPELTRGHVLAEPGARLVFISGKFVPANHQPPFTVKKVKSLLPEGLDKTVAEYQQRLPKPDHGMLGAETEVIFLGTGSALPSNFRNVSCTLLRVPSHGTHVFDCGENSLGQLQRMYGPDKADEIIRDIRTIHISHMHADHHLGVVSLVKRWFQLVHGGKVPPELNTKNSASVYERLRQGRRLLVTGQVDMNNFLREHAQIDDIGLDACILLEPRLDYHGRSFFSWDGQPFEFSPANEEDAKAVRDVIGWQDYKFAHVEHIAFARACAVTFADGFKFSFSGDCRPSGDFVQIGQDCDLLIHEATFEDQLIGEAKAKGHSTIGEALNVGLRMRAKNILLNHFSQRYPRMTLADEIDEKMIDRIGYPQVYRLKPPASNEKRLRLTDVNIGYTFDYTNVKMKNIARMQAMTPLVKQVMGLERMSWRWIEKSARIKDQAAASTDSREQQIERDKAQARHNKRLADKQTARKRSGFRSPM